MAALTLRSVKGAPLTNSELDANFTSLNTELGQKLVASSNLSDLTNAATARTNLGLGNVENKSSATIRSELTSLNVTTALGFTPLSNATSYLPLAGGTVSGILSLTGTNPTPLEIIRTGSNANANMRFSNTASTTFFGIGAQSGELRVGTTVDIYNTGNIVLHTGNVKTVNGNSIQGSGNIQIDGGVTSFNTRTGAVSLTSGDVTTALGYTPLSNATSYLPLSGGVMSGALRIYIDGSANLVPQLYWANAANNRAFNWQLDENNNAVLWNYNGSAWAKIQTITNTGDVSIASRFRFVSANAFTGGQYAIVGIDPAGATAGTYKHFGIYDYTNARSMFEVYGDTRNVRIFGSVQAGNNGFNASPAGTGFSHTLAANVGTNRVVNFDGNGLAPSVWWTNAGTAIGAIDAISGGGLSFWTNNGSSWQQQVEMTYGTFNVLTTLQQGGNQVLHAGNYQDYTAVSGAGGLNYNINGGDLNTTTATGFYRGSSLNGAPNTGWHFVITQGHDNNGNAAAGWTSQTAISYGAGNAGGITSTRVRQGSTTWSAWRTMLDSANFSSYALPLSGGTVTGDLLVQGASSRFPSHFYHYEYDAAGNVYEHYYAPGSENVKNSSANLRVASTSGYYKTLFFSGDGTFQWNSNTVLHAGNYSSYALPLSGGTLNGVLSFPNAIGTKLRFYDTATDKYGIDVQSSELRIYSGAQGDANGGITFGKFDGTTFTESMRVRNSGHININSKLYVGGATVNSGYNGVYASSMVGAASGNKLIYLYNDGSNIKLDAYDYGVGGALSFNIGGNGGTVNVPGALTQGGNQVLHAGNYTNYLADYTSGAYRVIADYAGGNTWYIRSNGRFTWARAHDWSQTFDLDLGGGTTNSNNGWARFGQQTSNSTAGTWFGTRFVQYTGGTSVDGFVRAGRYYLGDDTNYLTQGSGGAVRVQTGSGYIDVGSMNSSHAHLQTDRGSFYFNRDVYVDGQLYRYSGSAPYLHSANYNSYAPSLTGSGASGTWGINVTGSSGSVSGLTLNNSGAPINPDNVTQNQIGYNTSVSLFGQTDGGLYSSAYNSAWVHQIYGDFRTGQIAIRGKNSGTWQAWRTVLDSGNSTNYFSGGVNLSGHTISNSSWAGGGGYHGYTFNGGNWRFGFSSTGGVVDVYADGNFYATDSSHLVLHAGNYTNYVQLPYTGWPGYPGTDANGFYGGNWVRSSFTYSNNAPYTGAVAFFPAGGYCLQFNGAYGDSTGRLAFRNRNGDNGTWQPWREILHAGNYSSYALPLSGGSLTGTLNSVQSGYAAFMYGNGNTGAVSGIGLNVYSTGGNGAVMAFHRGGYYAVNMGLDSDNVFRIGGWSAAANRFQMDMSGNLTMNGNVTAYSDERLKKDWASLSLDFIERLAQIKSGTYTRIDSEERQAGASAQDWQALLPEVVSQDNEGYLALAYGNAAVVSVIELAKRVVEQDARIARLESLINKLLGE